MPLVAMVAVEKTVFTFDKLFSYAVPPELETAVRRGVRVLVPFGRGNRLSQGMVFSVSRESAGNCKQIISVLDEQPLLNEEGFAIVEFMTDTTFCTYYDAVRCLIPSGLSVVARESFTVCKDFSRGILPNLDVDEQSLMKLMLQSDSRRETDLLFYGPGSAARIRTA